MNHIIALIISELTYWYCRILKRNTQTFIIMVALASIFGITGSKNKYITVLISVSSFIISYRLLIRRQMKSNTSYKSMIKEDIVCLILAYIVGICITKEAILIIAIVSVMITIKVQCLPSKPETVKGVSISSKDIGAYTKLILELRSACNGYKSTNNNDESIREQEKRALKIFNDNIEKAKELLNVKETKCNGAYRIYDTTSIMGLGALRPRKYNYTLMALRNIFRLGKTLVSIDGSSLIGSKELDMSIKGATSTMYHEADIMDGVVIGKANDKKYCA